jgi:hypothetical protein
MLERRAVAVKIDNHPSARPQSGIQEADLIYELLVEGGLTRFIAVFHHSDSAYVGPIRSLRPTDPTLVTHLNAPLQISGGQEWIQRLSRSRGLLMIGDDQFSTFRVRTRSSPHNLYGTTERMRETADRRGWDDEPPEPIFNFGEPMAGLRSASVITLDWSSRPEVIWRFDPLSGTYLRSNQDDPHDWMSIDGDRRGQALLFYEGSVIEGTWERDSPDDPFNLALPSGIGIVVPRGKMWISVFPTTGSVDWE